MDEGPECLVAGRRFTFACDFEGLQGQFMKGVGPVPKFTQQNASLMGTARPHPVPLPFMNWPWKVCAAPFPL